ncbi:alpha/beta fold hydrolase [Bacillus sp. NEB1478]|uniref:alpha/beta fold hydrolase n=1 Tax=Bacillus sp. NEB1478 TaxID=3073816 RepID=UPI002873E761|nr:alpha/beta fold hydrolase [Bacillus sp. NEB1478]WNB90632.1 alpha/beta hydrolase [Bacillus sp. NEB1478]
MVSIKREAVGSIPFIMAEKHENAGKPLPLFIFVHGYTSAKEHNLHFAYTLAERGMRVILPDAMHHGERVDDHTAKRNDYDFWNIVAQGIQDVGILINWAKDRTLISNGEIALGGTSMGAIITYGSLVQYPEINAAIALMGTPAHEAFAKWQIERIENAGHKLPFSDEELTKTYEYLRSFDLTQNYEKLNKRPLFIWHSEVDQVVPYEFAKPFIEDLIVQNEKSVYMNDKTSGHKVSRPAYLNAVDWVLENIKKTKETV